MPAAAPAPAPAPDKAAEEPKDDDEADKCVFDKLCFGPVLTLGILNPLGIGVHARYDRDWGFGLDYQFLPEIGSGGAKAGISLLTIDGRLYPFAGSFFLSGGLAFQSASFSAIATDPTGNTTVKGSITVPTFKLGLGFMGHDGFVMGIDLALEIPLGGTSVDFESTASGAAGIAGAKKDINDAADLLVKALPLLFQLNLIRIGYLF